MNANQNTALMLYPTKPLIIKSLITFFISVFIIVKLKHVVNYLRFFYNNYKEYNTMFSKAKENQSSSPLLTEIISKETDIQIYAYVNQVIESKTNISNIKQLISSSKNEELMHNWELFKESEVVSFFCSLILPRYLHFITFTCIVLSKNKNNSHPINNILTSNWSLLKEAIDKVESYFRKTITEETNKMLLKTKVSSVVFEKTLKTIYDQLLSVTIKDEDSESDQIQLAFHSFYLEKIAEMIAKLESMDYVPDQMDKMNEIQFNIYFYEVYYDILSSQCSQCFLLSLFNQDYEHITKALATKAANTEKTIAQYVLYIDEIRLQMMNYDTSLFANENKAEGLLEQYRQLLEKA